MLLAHGADAQIRDKERQETALEVACTRGQYASLKVLCPPYAERSDSPHRARLSASDGLGDTALHRLLRLLASRGIFTGGNVEIGVGVPTSFWNSRSLIPSPKR